MADTDHRVTKVLYFVRNGETRPEYTQLVLGKHNSAMNQVLQRLSTKLGVNGMTAAINKLYTLDGRLITDLNECEHRATYVAADHGGWKAVEYVPKPYKTRRRRLPPAQRAPLPAIATPLVPRKDNVAVHLHDPFEGAGYEHHRDASMLATTATAAPSSGEEARDGSVVVVTTDSAADEWVRTELDLRTMLGDDSQSFRQFWKSVRDANHLASGRVTLDALFLTAGGRWPALNDAAMSPTAARWVRNALHHRPVPDGPRQIDNDEQLGRRDAKIYLVVMLYSLWVINALEVEAGAADTVVLRAGDVARLVPSINQSVVKSIARRKGSHGTITLETLVSCYVRDQFSNVFHQKKRGAKRGSNRGSASEPLSSSLTTSEGGTAESLSSSLVDDESRGSESASLSSSLNGVASQAVEESVSAGDNIADLTVPVPSAAPATTPTAALTSSPASASACGGNADDDELPWKEEVIISGNLDDVHSIVLADTINGNNYNDTLDNTAAINDAAESRAADDVASDATDDRSKKPSKPKRSTRRTAPSSRVTHTVVAAAPTTTTTTATTTTTKEKTTARVASASTPPVVTPWLDDDTAGKDGDDGKSITRPQYVSTTFDALEIHIMSIARDDNALEELWEAVDVNDNGKVSLAEIDKEVSSSFPLLNSKPALMRAYQQTRLKDGGDGDEWVQLHEFPQLLVNILYFNKLFQCFDVRYTTPPPPLLFCTGNLIRQCCILHGCLASPNIISSLPPLCNRLASSKYKVSEAYFHATRVTPRTHFELLWVVVNCSMC
jgi:hypothetical protein